MRVAAYFWSYNDFKSATLQLRWPHLKRVYHISVTDVVTVREFFLVGRLVDWQLGLVIMENEGSYRNNYLDKNYAETVGCS